MKNRIPGLCALLLICLLPVCQAKAAEGKTDRQIELSDFARKRIGVMEGTIQEDMVREQFPKAEISVYTSASTAALGTLLGFGLCMLRQTRNRAIRAVTTVYIRIMQGTPQVVLLMIMFYLVFTDTRIPGEWVTVVTFAMNSAAYVCEIFRSGIESVDAGQTEAALAIGFTKTAAFFKVVLPQAVLRILPVYRGEVISLIKMTSIVGYIAVQDLTKMSDIIRSRTYQAFSR